MTPRTPRRSRALAVAAVAALGLTLAAPAQAAGETDAATTWLDGQLTDGLVENQEFAFTDVGLSIDVGLLGLATGDAELAQTVADALPGAVETYVGGGTAGGDGEVYASSVAKAARFVQLSGGDPSDVGGRDLVSDLEILTDDGSGRIADQSQFGDFAATIGQSFAAAALTDAGSSEADAALGFLLQQQCPGGGFRQGFGSDDSDATCTDDADAGVDSTALAIQLLAPLDRAGTELGEAADYLEGVQDVDGSFGAQDGVNTNSTGLAAYALSLQGRDEAATRAADYVRGLQVRAPGVCTDTDEGAVAFDRAAFDGQKLNGITSATSDQFVRATAQGALGLDAVTTPTTPLSAVAQRSYVRARTLEPVLVGGLAPRSTVCVSINGVGLDEVAGLDGSATVRVTTGPGTAARVFEVEDTDGRSTEVTLNVLGRTTLRVIAPNRRREGGGMRVVATGLESGERATLQVAPGERRAAFANRDGRVIFRQVPITRNAGDRRYVVRGKFGRIRKGSDVVRVLPARS